MVRLACISSQLMSLFTSGASSRDLWWDTATCLAEAMSKWQPWFRIHLNDLNGRIEQLLIAVFTASAASDCETLPPNAVSYMNAKTPRLLSWKLLDHVLTKGKCSKGCTGSFRAPLQTMNFTIGRSLWPIAIERGLLVHGSPFLHNQTKIGRSFFLSPSPKSPHTVFNKMWLQGRSASCYIFELQQDHVIDQIWCIWQPYKWSHDFGTPQRCKEWVQAHTHHH